MGDSDASSPLRTVRRRVPVLRALDGDVMRISELVDVLDLSRSTVDRALQDLVDLAFVERRDGGYALTLAGDLAVTEYDRYEDRLETLTAVRGVLSGLPPDAQVPAAVLDGARVVEAEPHAPNLPVRPLCDLLDEASSVRAFAPAIVTAQVECYRRNVVDGGMKADLVLTDPVVDRLVTDFREDLTESLRTERLRVRNVGPVTFPFSLLVAERPAGPTMCLLVYADNGVHGFVGNDDSAAVEWARDRLEECWAAATPLNRPSGV